MCNFGCRFLVKSLCSKRPYNSKILLSFTTICKILLELVRGAIPFYLAHSQILWTIFLLLWVLVFWTNIIVVDYCLMHCSLPLPCAWNARKKIQIHLPKLIWLMMIIGILPLCYFCLLPISRTKFVMFWNLSFLCWEDMKKENLTICYV